MTEPAHVATSMLAASARRAVDADSKSAEAYRAIKDMIVSLELPPAALLDERGLAERLGVGLTPVRQALRRLEWESLVVILPRRGTLVADLNDSDLGRIYELRSVLEPQAAELAAERGTPEQRAALAAVIAAMHAELARPTPDRRVLIALDRDLHRQIWAMAGNEMLEQTLEWLFSHVLRRWNVSIDRNESLGSVMQMHDEIADAIVAGDAQQARAAMARHVAGFQASQTS
ncbi:MAG: GntR family transcriptional regulator [Gaiellales bacterium]|nr:GntR family transcriptional regulator [Gaiellales bacterium]